jgi:FecR-like protein
MHRPEDGDGDRMTPNERFEELWTDFFEGELDAAGLEELQQMLSADPALARHAADLYGEHRLLGLAHQTDDRFAKDTLARAFRDREGFVADVVRHAAPRPSRVRRVLGYVAVAAAAFLLSLGVQQVLSAPPPEPVATLILATGARWSGHGVLPEGQRLLQGRHRLLEGTAAIRFDSGAIMLLAGPSDLVLESRARAVLHSGRVTVEASEAYGFTVGTPKGEAVDLGTEFAVAVESSGATEVHVLQGEVAWERPSEKTRLLQTGQAVRFDSGHEGRAVPLSGRGVKELMLSMEPEPSKKTLTAYEGFDYPAGSIESSRASGGFGFAGPWRVRTPEEQAKDADPSTALGIGPASLQGPWALPSPSGGALVLPAGRTFRIRPLAEPIDLGKDGVTYVSFLMRQDPVAVGDQSFFRLTFRSSEDFWNRAIGFGMPPLRRPSLYRNRENFNSSVPFETGPVQLWVCKIAAQRHGPDQVFHRIFRVDETVASLEPAVWTNQTTPFESDMKLDLVLVTGTGRGRQEFDELRIGRTWASVTRKE